MKKTNNEEVDELSEKSTLSANILSLLVLVILIVVVLVSVIMLFIGLSSNDWDGWSTVVLLIIGGLSIYAFGSSLSLILVNANEIRVCLEEKKESKNKKAK